MISCTPATSAGHRVHHHGGGIGGLPAGHVEARPGPAATPSSRPGCRRPRPGGSRSPADAGGTRVTRWTDRASASRSGGRDAAQGTLPGGRVELPGAGREVHPVELAGCTPGPPDLPGRATSSRMAATIRRVSGSAPAIRGRNGSSASRGGTVRRRIRRHPRWAGTWRLDFDRMEPAESPPIFLGLVAVVVLVLANAFFVAAEFALVGARRTRLDEMARGGRPQS